MTSSNKKGITPMQSHWSAARLWFTWSLGAWALYFIITAPLCYALVFASQFHKAWPTDGPMFVSLGVRWFSGLVAFIVAGTILAWLLRGRALRHDWGQVRAATANGAFVGFLSGALLAFSVAGWACTLESVRVEADLPIISTSEPRFPPLVFFGPWGQWSCRGGMFADLLFEKIAATGDHPDLVPQRMWIGPVAGVLSATGGLLSGAIMALLLERMARAMRTRSAV